MQSQNISEAETQFIDLPDDDVNLWDALEIVGESATQFKIKWDGTNPATGKPWPDSWVQKHDATPDLVQGWRVNHPRKISTASTSSGRRAKTSSTRTRKGKSRGGSETTASRRSTKSKSPVKYVSRPLSNRGLKREYDEYDEPPGAGPSNLQSQFQTRKRKHSPEVTIDDQSVSMAPPRPKKQRPTKTVAESISDEVNGDKYARNLRRKGAKEVPGVISDSEVERTENMFPYRRERKGTGKAIFLEPESEDEMTRKSPPKSRSNLDLNRYPSSNSGYVLIDSAKKKKLDFTDTEDEDVQKQAETKHPTLNPGPSTSRAQASRTTTNDDIVHLVRPKPFAKKTTTRTPKPKPKPRTAARDNPTSSDETDELDDESSSRKYPHPQKTLPIAPTLVDRSISRSIARVANQSSFVLNPDSPLAQRTQTKQNNAQSHSTSEFGKSGILLKNQPLDTDNVPAFVPSGSKTKTTRLPPPASKSDALHNSSIPAELNDIQPQPASPSPHTTHTHVSRSSEPANPSGALRPNQRASESVPLLKTTLQSSPEPLRSPVIRESVISPGTIVQLQEFDEFLASLPPDSPTPPTLPRVALQVEENVNNEPVDIPMNVVNVESPFEPQYPDPDLDPVPIPTTRPEVLRHVTHTRAGEQKINRPVDYSGNSSIVPETELGNSQSHPHFQPFSQSQSQASYLPSRPPTRPSSPVRSPIKSGMKGKSRSNRDLTMTPAHSRTTTPLDVDDMNVELSMTVAGPSSPLVPPAYPAYSPSPSAQRSPSLGPRSKERKHTKALIYGRRASVGDDALRTLSGVMKVYSDNPVSTGHVKVGGDNNDGPMRTIRYGRRRGSSSLSSESSGEVIRKTRKRERPGNEGKKRREGEGVELKTKPKLNQKPLGPIPVVSPSKFYPHLPSAQDNEPEVPTALDDSIETWPSPQKKSVVEVTASVKGRNSKGKQQTYEVIADPCEGGDENVETREHDGESLITNSQAGVALIQKGISLSQTSDVLAKQVRLRGSEMAEARRRQQRLEMGLDPPKRRSLDEIIGNIHPSNSKGKEKEDSGTEGGSSGQFKEREHQDKEVDESGNHGPNTNPDLVDVDPNAANGASSVDASMDGERGLNESTFEPRYSEAPPDSDPKSSSRQVQPQDQAERDAMLQELASLQERLAAAAVVNNSLISEVEALRFVQARVDELTGENGTLQKNLEDAVFAQTSRNAAFVELNSKFKQLEQQNEALKLQNQDFEQQNQTLNKQNQILEQQDVALSQELSTALAATSSAEKDRDFFRDQYNTASGYASEVRLENIVLLQRAEIAETQASEGVGLIKATYEERLRVSEEQSRTFSRIADFMMKKDQATDGIRQQAAEAPELKAKCRELEEEINQMRKEMRSLEGEVEVEQLRVEALEREKEEREKEREAEWENEMRTVQEELRESKLQVASLAGELSEVRTSKNPNGVSEVGTSHPNKLVYRCEWTEPSPCLFFCETRKELEDHMIYGGHIEFP